MSQITAVILGSGGAGPILTLTGNSGGAVPPTAGNINIVGSGILSVAGNAGTSTLTISATNPIPIANGGTNATSMATTDGTIYFDGTRLVTTATGTAGQVLTSNGAGVAPTYQAAASGGITSITGDSGGAQSGPAITLTGGTSGGTFAGAANTLTLAFTELNLPTTSNNTHGVININGVPVFHTFGTNNLFVGAQGAQAGNFTLSATNCTVVGGLAGQSITNSNFSHFFGWGAGLNSTGIANSYFGYTAGVTNVTGQYNCAFGMQSGTNNSTSGSYNLFIGYFGGANYTGSESSNVLLNSPGVASDNNTLRIGAGTGSGNQQLASAYISGIFGKTVGVSGVPVVVANNDQLGTVVSSERYKENIEDMDDYSEDILKLRCVRFNYKNHSSKDISVGLIAEEVEDVMSQLVVRDKEGRPETVKYLDLIPMLLNEIQKLKREVKDLIDRVEELELL